MDTSSLTKLKYGNINVVICPTSEEVAKVAASHFITQLQQNPKSVIGLATGASPVQTYQELVKSYERKEISFAQVTSFNLDEYYGLEGDHPESYRYFMDTNLFNHVDIKPYKTHVLNGKAAFQKLECQSFEDKIYSVGGIDLWLLGIGSNGHVAFNEPGSGPDTRTRIISLAQSTIDAVVRTGAFGPGEENIPKFALTAGVGTIMEARKLVLIANGKGKAEAIRDALQGKVGSSCPASFLKGHQDVTFILDSNAASLLTPSQANQI